MVQGDLLFTLSASIHLADLETRTALLLLVALIPIETLGAWFLWRRLPATKEQKPSPDDRDD